MDRLLCGDVGYGKTEVAMRAAFKAVLDGKQVAVLAPTTILADQHFRTFKRRFAAFPVTIELLSRFRSRPEQKDVVAKVADGSVDILIATHRMLGKDLAFRDLGLLIVDEEQRFGVAQKERLKEWKASIDVLSMAAKIARGIVTERSRGPIASTRQLARIVAGEKGSRERIDPATRVFQALRIEVNQELVALARFLAAAVARANGGGRLAVISYHSLEDRIVKEAFRRESGVCLCPPRLPACVCGARAALKVLTRRPIRPSEGEQRRNPRSRSARLRVAVKITRTDLPREDAAQTA